MASKPKEHRYSDYHAKKTKHKSRNSKRHSAIKKNNIKIPSITETLCSKEYLCNKYNSLRFLVLLITLILLFISLLYGIGSIHTLTLQDFFCDDYQWSQVVEYNRAQNSSGGVAGCYVSTRVEVNDDVLFETDINKNALIVTQDIHTWSIFRALLFFIIIIILTFLFVKYCIISIIDCKKTANDEWYVIFFMVILISSNSIIITALLFFFCFCV